jgi:hypothetical protein
MADDSKKKKAAARLRARKIASNPSERDLRCRKSLLRRVLICKSFQVSSSRIW